MRNVSMKKIFFFLSYFIYQIISPSAKSIKTFKHSDSIKKCQNEKKDLISLMNSYFLTESNDNLKNNEQKPFLSKKYADLVEISNRFTKKGGEKDINYTKFFGFKPESDELKSKQQILKNFSASFEELIRLLDQIIQLERDFIKIYRDAEKNEKIEPTYQIVAEIREMFFTYHDLIEQKEVVHKYSDFFVMPKSNLKNVDSTIFSEICIENILERKQFLAGGFANINKIKAS